MNDSRSDCPEEVSRGAARLYFPSWEWHPPPLATSLSTSIARHPLSSLRRCIPPSPRSQSLWRLTDKRGSRLSRACLTSKLRAAPSWTRDRDGRLLDLRDHDIPPNSRGPRTDKEHTHGFHSTCHRRGLSFDPSLAQSIALRRFRSLPGRAPHMSST